MRRARRVQQILHNPAADPLLFGSPLRRPGVGPAVVLALLVVLLFALSQIVGLVVRAAGAGVLGVFAQALLGSSLLSVVPLAVLWYLDRRERETPWLLVAAFLWGGLIATGLALPVNQAVLGAVDAWIEAQPGLADYLGSSAATLIGAPIAGPLVEETTKGLGLLLLVVFLGAEFDDLRDGLIYGALVGAGFNWLESAMYVTSGYAATGVAPFGAQLGGRYALFGLGGHVLYTALTGAGLGLARQTSRPWLRLLAPLAGLTLAILCHALNNVLGLLVVIALRSAGEPLPDPDAALAESPFLEVFFARTVLQLILFLPALVLLAVALWRSGVWERRVIRDELRDELQHGEGASGAPTVTAAELAAIERDGIFRTRRPAGPSRAERRRVATLMQAQNELAFRKHRARASGADPESDPLVLRWREAIAGLRAQLPAAR